MCYLLLPDGSSLFKLPIPEDFAWHCMFAALNRDLKLRMIKAPLSAGLFLFPVCLFSLSLTETTNPRGWLCWRAAYLLPARVAPRRYYVGSFTIFYLTFPFFGCKMVAETKR